MDFEVWTEPKAEKPTYVKLVKEASGFLHLCVVDVEGRRLEGGTIAELTATGLYRLKGLAHEYGFSLDEQGRIRDAKA